MVESVLTSFVRVCQPAGGDCWSTSLLVCSVQGKRRRSQDGGHTSLL